MKSTQFVDWKVCDFMIFLTVLTPTRSLKSKNRKSKYSKKLLSAQNSREILEIIVMYCSVIWGKVSLESAFLIHISKEQLPT